MSLSTVNELKSRAPIARMLLIHEEVKTGKYPNRTSLSLLLEVSAKTVQRDIDFMRDRLGLPISYESARHGYFYSQDVQQFPSMQMAQGEMQALEAARDILRMYQGTPFEKGVSTAVEKMNLQWRDSSQNSRKMPTEWVSFRSTGMPILDVKIFQKLAEAISDNREVELLYHKLRGEQEEWRCVRPYHVSCQDLQWYLIAYDIQRKDVRTFALTRIKKIKVTPKSFQPDASFSIAQHLKDSFGISSNSGTYVVRIRFDDIAARLVSERLWHPTQKIRTFKNGQIELRMVLGSLTEVKRWILSWGRHAQVLSRKKLIQRIAEDVKAQAGYYCI